MDPTARDQLVGRYDLKRVWARDRWHLTARWLRKLLSHTIGVHLCQRQGLPRSRSGNCCKPNGKTTHMTLVMQHGANATDSNASQLAHSNT